MTRTATVPQSPTPIRRFNITTEAPKGLPRTFVITEIEPTHDYPLNWIDIPFSYTREGAWKAAKAQPLPVVFVGRDGSRKELGIVFDPTVYEQHVYAVDCSDRRAMSDAAFFAPQAFESWVHYFRAGAKKNDVAVLPYPMQDGLGYAGFAVYAKAVQASPTLNRK